MTPFVHRLGAAVRSLGRSPAFALLSVLTLAIGIGANTAIFSVVHAVLLRPLPYPQAPALVDVSNTAPGIGLPEFDQSDATYLLYRERSRTLEDLGIYVDRPVNLTGDGTPERLTATAVTASVFPVLGVAPAEGRGFLEEEERPGAEPVAVLSHSLWRQRYGGDPGLVGRSIQVGGVARRVVGIMPEGFAFPDPDTRLWLPLAIDPAATEAGNFNFTGLGRLAPGATPSAAEAELDGIQRLLPEVYPGDITLELMEKAQMGALVTPLREKVVGDVGRALWILLGTVGFILLIACANVANLFLVRAESRQREVAVRTALGAGRGDLLRHFLVESLLLAALAGALGLVLAAAGVQLLVALGPENVPRLHEVGIDAVVVAFTAAVALAAGLLFGTFPLLRWGGAALVAPLKDGGRGATLSRGRLRLRGVLVAGQVALALVLLTGSGLMVRSFLELRDVDPGVRPEGVLTLRLSLPAAVYPGAADAAGFHAEALERIRALPGVEAAGAVSNLPLSGHESNQSTALEDFPRAADELPLLFNYKRTSPGYFAAAGIPILRGRPFEPADWQERRGAVVVSAALAERFWPGQSPLGRRLQPGLGEEGGWYTIVGVAGSTREHGLTEEPTELIYYPLVGLEGDEGWVARSMTLVVRTGGDPVALAGPVRSAIWDIDPNLPIANVETLAAVVARSTARTSFTTLLLLIAAGVALVLGAVGLYGVVSYVVGQRRQEIGVRMALGAHRGDVSRMVVRQGLVVALAGIAIGLAGALALTRSLAALLYGVSPTDPVTFATVAVVLAGVSVLASYLPARRAASVEPVEALRYD